MAEKFKETDLPELVEIKAEENSSAEVAVPVPADNAEQASAIDSLYQACVDAAPRLEKHVAENFGESQGPILSMAVCMAVMVLLGAFATVIVEILVNLRDGPKSDTLSHAGQMAAILMPGVLMGVPALTWLGNRFDRSGMYRWAESTHKTLYGIVNWAPFFSQYKPFAAIELAAFQASVGKNIAARSILDELSAKSNLNEIGANAMIAALRAQAYARSGEHGAALKLAAKSQDLLDNSALEEKAKGLLEGQIFTCIGNSLLACGKYQEALAAYSRALAKRLNTHTASRANVAILTSQIGVAHSKLNHIDSARQWTDLALEILGEDGGLVNERIQVLLNAATTCLASDPENAKSLLKSADELVKRSRMHPDMGRLQYLLGVIHSEESDWAVAAQYFERALKLASRYLPKQDPLNKQILEKYAEALRAAGENERAFTVDYLASHYSHPETVSESADAVEDVAFRLDREAALKRTASMAKARKRIFVLISLWLSGTLIWEGFRAAGPVCWTFVVLTGMLLAWLGYVHIRHVRKTKRILKQSESLTKVSAKVSFAKITDNSWGNHIFMARIAEPFHVERVVSDEMELLTNNVAFFAREQDAEIVLQGDQPVSVVTQLGPVELATQQVSVNEALKPKGLKGVAVLLSVFVLGPILIWSMVGKALPVGLTAYEYYRHAACNLDSDFKYHSFYDIKESEDDFKKAVALDKNGVIGKHAQTCLESELPVVIPDSAIFHSYEEVLAGKCSFTEAKYNLEQCIKNAPKFDWAYSELAEQYIAQGGLDQAKKLLEQAAAVNPRSVRYLYARAKLELAQHNKTAALATLEEARSLDPFYLETYEQLLSAVVSRT